jgi:hypothetical protein
VPRPHLDARSADVQRPDPVATERAALRLCPFVPFSPFRRSSYVSLGGLNRELELVQDWELWIRLLSSGDLLYVPRLIGLWQTHAISGAYATTFAAEHIDMARRLPALIPSISRATLSQAKLAQRSRALIWSVDGQAKLQAEAALQPLIRRAAAWLALERAICTARLLIRMTRDHVRN